MSIICSCPGIRRESPRVGLLRCREEPPRLLGNRFQERFFLLRGRCLLLLKEKKVRCWGERGWMLEAPEEQLCLHQPSRSISCVLIHLSAALVL